MPNLNWSTKALPEIPPGTLEVDSIIYPQGRGYLDILNGKSMPDKVILGDNLAVMSALLPDYAGAIDLIYADPPFFTNRRYPARIGRGEDSRKPADWQLADGYPDHWEDIDAYLDMLYPRLVMMHRLLSPTGTLYLHLDWHANAYARVLLDEIFGYERLLNEIVWVYHGPSPIKSAYNRKHDTILAYTKSKQYTFNVDDVRQPYDPSTVKTFASSPKAGFGKVPDLERGKVPEDWWYFPVVARLHNERTGYPTQKPEALLERIILASSNPGDIVADFFCGSGTTAVVAERLGRHFLASDVASRAVHTTRSRMVHQSTEPFSMLYQSSSKYPYSPPLSQTDAIRHEGDMIIIDSDEKMDIDYWELDPAWNKNVFYSTAQAIRPLRKGSIQTALPLPASAQTEKICVRMVTVDGNFEQFVF